MAANLFTRMFIGICVHLLWSQQLISLYMYCVHKSLLIYLLTFYCLPTATVMELSSSLITTFVFPLAAVVSKSPSVEHQSFAKYLENKSNTKNA